MPINEDLEFLEETEEETEETGEEWEDAESSAEEGGEEGVPLDIHSMVHKAMGQMSNQKPISESERAIRFNTELEKLETRKAALLSNELRMPIKEVERLYDIKLQDIIAEYLGLRAG